MTGGAEEGDEEGGEDCDGDGGGEDTDTAGVSNRVKPGICPVSRCKPRPLVALTPDEGTAPVPAAAKALEAEGLAVGSVAPVRGTVAPVVPAIACGSGIAAVAGMDAWLESVLPAIEMRRSPPAVVVGCVEGLCGTEVPVCELFDGAAIVASPGRFVSLR